MCISDVCSLPSVQEWIPLAWSSRCWRRRAPRPCPCRICCSHRRRCRAASTAPPCCTSQRSAPDDHTSTGLNSKRDISGSLVKNFNLISHLVCSSVAVECDTHLIIALVLTGERHSSPEGNLTSDKHSVVHRTASNEVTRCLELESHLSAHNAVSTVEILCVHVHRASFAFSDSASTT